MSTPGSLGLNKLGLKVTASTCMLLAYYVNLVDAQEQTMVSPTPSKSNLATLPLGLGTVQVEPGNCICRDARNVSSDSEYCLS
jgi:hypothetical protein